MWEQSSQFESGVKRMEAKTYKIVLVEDEIIIRENIRKSVEWSKYGYEFCGEAANGEQALEIIEDIIPDVVITDIRMPFMDGIELSRILKSLYPKMKVLILSGHMEFSYAKEAIGIGVYDYLIKPITPMKLIKTLLKLKEVLDNEQEEKRIIQLLTEEIKSIEDKAINDSIVLCAKDLMSEKEKEQQFIEFLRCGHLENVDKFVDDYVSDQNNKAFASALYCTYFGIKMVATCIRVIEEFGGVAESVFSDFNNISEYVKKLANNGQIISEMKKLIMVVIEYRNKTINSSALIVEEAKKYIIAHIGNPELSLNDVANNVGLSPNYFSSIFKKATGETFVRQITNMKIEYAKELLTTTKMTTAEIAESVGYNDTNYFISVFRRNCGMTTKEYRRIIQS